jgi:hypothetical protein
MSLHGVMHGDLGPHGVKSIFLTICLQIQQKHLRGTAYIAQYGSKLLLVLASIVVIGFGPRRDP